MHSKSTMKNLRCINMQCPTFRVCRLNKKILRSDTGGLRSMMKKTYVVLSITREIHTSSIGKLKEVRPNIAMTSTCCHDLLSVAMSSEPFFLASHLPRCSNLNLPVSGVVQHQVLINGSKLVLLHVISLKTWLQQMPVD